MKSILNQIKSMKGWDYYPRKKEDFLDHINDWNNHEEHKNFIKTFLRISGKSIIQNAFEEINGLKLEKFERLEHINSVFFLGCLLYKNTIFSEKINFDRPKNYEKDEFYFIWFLTSLVHDFGYYIEKNVPEEVDNNIESFKSYLGNKDEENDFYDLLSEEFDISDNLKILLGSVPIYYRARLDGQIGRGNRPKIDHGISAGLILFNTLKNIRIKKQQELTNAGITDDIDREKLYWGNDLDKFYYIAASSIATHNMRRAKREESLSKVYQDYGMNDMILEEGKIQKISINDDPFLLLFSIADTIEPTKTFDCVKPSYTLENILITFENDSTIKICNKEGSDLDFEKLKKKVKGLDVWLDMALFYPDENSITIKINQ